MKRLLLLVLVCLLVCSGCSAVSGPPASQAPSDSSAGPQAVTDVPEPASSLPAESTAEASSSDQVSSSPYGRLPALYLTTNNGKQVTSKTDYLAGTFAVQIGEGTLYSPSLSVSKMPMQIKGRGMSSWEWPKKPYRIKLETKTALFGLPEAKDWILRPSYSDKALIRDHIASVMGNKLKYMDFVPRTVLVDVYFNQAYQGVYVLSERIEIAKGRLELSESPAADTGYVIEIGGASSSDTPGVDYFNTNSFVFAYVSSPARGARTAQQMQFITEYTQQADAAVIALDGYENYIDIPSLIDWFILHELTYNLDSSFRRSCFITKDAGGKLKMGPPWDFDLAFGNHYRYNNYPNVWASVSREDGYVGVTWMDHLLKDPAFTSQLKIRWNQVGGMLLRTALDEIDLCEQVIDASQKENYKTWNTMGRKVAFEPNNIAGMKTYAENLQQMRSFLRKRKSWMDQQIAKF